MDDLCVYGDESASPRVFVLSVCIATVQNWASFKVQWQRALEEAGLRQPDGTLLPFHMAEFESRFAPFDKWDDKTRVQVLRSLIHIIHSTKILSVSVRLPIDLYRRYVRINAHLPITAKSHLIMKYMICFVYIHAVVSELVQGFELPDPIPIVMDRNRDLASMVQSVVAGTNQSRMAPDLIKTPVFRDKSVENALQAADLVAYELMKQRDNVLLGYPKRRKSFEFLTGGSKNRHRVIDLAESDFLRLSGQISKFVADGGVDK